MRWLWSKKPSDECCRLWWGVSWNSIVVALNASVRVLERFCLERRLAEQQRIENASNGPNVHFERVTTLLQHLRSNIIGSAAKRLLPLAFVHSCR